MISFGSFLPNILSRTCTLSMKIFTTNTFLSDWFAQKEGIERLGHYGEEPKMSNSNIIKTHLKNNGSVPDKILLSKKKFVRSSPFVRKK